MSTYLSDVKTNKTFTSNVVIKFAEMYFAIREPDSGLNIQSPNKNAVASLSLNPTSVDPRRVTTTISSATFKIVDLQGILTSVMQGDASDLFGQSVEIYLGRSGINMDFADYFQLPITYINKCEHIDNAYIFSSTEQTERMAKPIYDVKSALAVDILAGTTTWTMRDSIASFPTSGFLKVDTEIVSYTGKDLVNNYFTGVVRGELSSVPAAHATNTDVFLLESVTDNPLNIILKILISGGGGGTYDVLKSGLGISNALIDIAEIEALRDSSFLGKQFTLVLFNIDSALKTLETELLAPNNLRLTYSLNSKVALALLDKAQFVEEIDIIDHTTLTKPPKWSVDGAKITNSIEIQWDFSDGTNVFFKRNVYEDAASILAYGKKTPLKFEFKGIKSALAGQEIVDDFGTKLLARLAYPTPTITANTQLNKSLQNVGDRAYLVSSHIPAVDGSLDFASDLEIISRSINHTNGDVVFTLAFTSYTSIRSGFVAPSDLILSTVSQKKINVAAGRAAQYMVGWYMRLWDEVSQAYTSDAINKIVGFDIGARYLLTQALDRLTTEGGDALILDQASSEDSILFENDWTTPITSPNNYRIRFANYEEVISSQKRYAFISNEGNDFDDSKPTYKVTY
jgi:hypothetical protein